MKRIARGWAAGLYAAVALALVALPESSWAEKPKPAKKAFEEGKAAAKKLLEGGKNVFSEFLDEAFVSDLMPAGSFKTPPKDGRAAGLDHEVYAAAELNCGTALSKPPLLMGEALSEACEGMRTPVQVAPDKAADAARTLLSYCDLTVSENRAPGTAWDKHCRVILDAYIKAMTAEERRERVLEGVVLTAPVVDTGAPTDLKDAYSACHTEVKELLPARTTTETCEILRMGSEHNRCNKRLRPEVTWHCPPGAVAGPTRVKPGTPDHAGEYTCKVPVVHIEYSCPAGWAPPAWRVIPPGPAEGWTCEHPDTKVISRAIETPKEVLEDRAASYRVVDKWDSGCKELESHTPRDLMPGDAPRPLAPFDSTPDTARCVMTGVKCDAPDDGAHVINDVPVRRACWVYEEEFACRDATKRDDCAYRDDCEIIREECSEWDTYSTPPSCLAREIVRKCPDGERVTREVTSCADQTFCPGGADGYCFDTGSEPNQEFGQAAAAMEAGRQAGRYYTAMDLEVFKGYKGSCKEDLGLTINCCKKNKLRDTLFGMLSFASNMKHGKFKDGPETDPVHTKDENDKPLFTDRNWDVLFVANTTGALSAGMRGMGALIEGHSKAWDQIKNQEYGRAVATIFVTTPRDLAHAIDSGFKDAITNVLTLGGILAGCDDEDQVLLKKKDENLCEYVGKKCTKEIGPFCWKRESRYCCFTSILGKLINTQGRAQLIGKGMGHGRIFPDTVDETHPFGVARKFSCDGFSLDQLSAIDFSKLDLSEFIATVVPAYDGKEGFDEFKKGAIARALNTHGDCEAGSAQCADGTPPVHGGDASLVPGVGRDDTSIRPILMRAFKDGSATGTIRNDDIRLISSYRFHRDDIPLKATARVAGPHPMRADCKLMTVEMHRDEVTSTWTDLQYFDPVTRKWRPAKPGDPGINHTRTWPASTRTYNVGFCSDGSVPKGLM